MHAAELDMRTERRRQRVCAPGAGAVYGTRYGYTARRMASIISRAARLR